MTEVDSPHNAMVHNHIPQPPVRRPNARLWPSRIWPTLRYSAAPRRTLLAALGTGVVGAIVLGSPGIGYPITAAALLVVVACARPERLTTWHVAGAVAVLAFSTVAVFLSADWIVTMSVWSAVFVAGAVLSSSWSWTGLLLGAATPILLPARVVRWTARGKRGLGGGRARVGRAAVVGAVTAVLVLVFAALFAGADPAFERILDEATPEWDLGAAIGRALIFLLVTSGTLAAAYLATNRPRFDGLTSPVKTTFRLWEWMIPVGALVALFGAFVAVQIASLFGGQTHVLVTDGLTNAEYARQGFWQLLTVTALTLLVIAITIRKAPRVNAGERLALRVVLGLLCLLSLVVVASALHRMSLYEQQYGYTTLRLFVTAVELLLGSVFLLIMASGIRMSDRWLPRAVGVAAVLTVLGLAVLNPDAYIARHNVERFEDTGKIDTSYLSELSSDAVPELERLPEPYRSCALGNRHDDDRQWFEYNVSESRARAIEPRMRAQACSRLGVSVR
ncbi:DUF4173 domain-containing protein [Rhodococcus sp. G-MC3]|uniref:DUF4153 domain-containing protein n=1 Tax=Rhodococcus sp. G-MC3 TaxID=3046209 RepID=UPI0024BB6515|nr:DUF4173 domain-containing protein [Rhodococcus sp. G-MC3]MDJ0396536.1 DUF4173 domain-containing protein [Rhodococcus sp. G-MC3]